MFSIVVSMMRLKRLICDSYRIRSDMSWVNDQKVSSPSSVVTLYMVPSKASVFYRASGVVGQEIEGLAFPYTAVTFFPVLYAGHIAHDIEHPYQ